MDCETVQTELTALLMGEHPGHPLGEIEAHVAGCADCLRARRETEAVWKGLDHLHYESVPRTLRLQTLQAVHKEAGVALAPAGVLTLRRLVSAVGAGILAALLFTYVLGLRVDLGYLSTTQLMITAIIWSGLLIAAFCWILGQYQQWGVRLDAASRLGIAATGLSLVGTFLCPDKTFFDLWEKSSLAGMLNGPFELGIGYLIFGFAYALLPALIVSVALGRRLKGNLWQNSVVASGAFVMLLLPAAYLQCASLAVGLIGTWTLGALGGALGGILSGVKLWQFRAHRAAV